MNSSLPVIITDPVEAFRILEQNGQEDFDPGKNHFSFFHHGNEFAVLFFRAGGICRGPRLMLFQKPVTPEAIEHSIVEERFAIHDQQLQGIMDEALLYLRELIETRSAGFYSFDAH